MSEPHLQRRSSCSARGALLPELRRHQPPTEPRAPHEATPVTEKKNNKKNPRKCTATQRHDPREDTHKETPTHATAHHKCPFFLASLQLESAADFFGGISRPEDLAVPFFFLFFCLSRLVQLEHQRLPIILMSRLLPDSPEAEVSIEPPRTIREQMASSQPINK